MNKIYWLASYPKSGNTWVRIFITNYLKPGDQPADINDLEGGPIGSDRELFDRWAGVEASDLSFEDIANLRPHVYRQMAQHVEHPVYLKVHDACTRNSEGDLLFPVDITGGVVYVIRNPLDVAVSYSHHGGRSLEQVVDGLCADDGYVRYAAGSLPDQLPQRLLSWSSHVRSWVDESGLPVTVIRYEDLLADPRATFERVLRVLSVEIDPARLVRAVAFSQFEVIQEQEKRAGFKERDMRADAPFFRHGRSGSWRKELAPELADRIITTHAVIMRRFGYLDAHNQPVF